jgi:RNase P/RNase MRP subunit p30
LERAWVFDDGSCFFFSFLMFIFAWGGGLRIVTYATLESDVDILYSASLAIAHQ